MAPERPLAVADTSVIFKWFVTTREADLEAAQALREDVAQGRIGLIEPDVLLYELLNLLRVASEGGRLSSRDAMEVGLEFAGLNLPLVATTPLIDEAYRLALERRISLFDALFLVTAQLLEAQLVSDDRNLVNACNQSGVRAILLRDYPAQERA